MKDVQIKGFTSREHASLTVTSAAAVSLPSSKIRPESEPFLNKACQHVKITLDPDSESVRVTCGHNITPTAALGDLLVGGDILELDNDEDILNFKAIALTDNVTLHVTYGF